MFLQSPKSSNPAAILRTFWFIKHLPRRRGRYARGDRIASNDEILRRLSIGFVVRTATCTAREALR